MKKIFFILLIVIGISSSSYAQEIKRMNNFFGYSVVEKLKLVIFNDELEMPVKNKKNTKNVAINKYKNSINNVKNEKVRKSLIEFTKVFREK